MNKLGIENYESIVESMIKTVNSERKLSKNKWYSVTVTYKDYDINFQGYNTWLRTIKINGEKTGISSGMDIKVKDFVSFLDNFLHSIIDGNYTQYLTSNKG